MLFLLPGDNEEDVVIGWQEKLFSQVRTPLHNENDGTVIECF